MEFNDIIFELILFCQLSFPSIPTTLTTCRRPILGIMWYFLKWYPISRGKFQLIIILWALNSNFLMQSVHCNVYIFYSTRFRPQNREIAREFRPILIAYGLYQHQRAYRKVNFRFQNIRTRQSCWQTVTLCGWTPQGRGMEWGPICVTISCNAMCGDELESG